MVFTYPQANTRNTYRQNAVSKESNESRGFLKPSNSNVYFHSLLVQERLILDSSD
jgi:hypothetical protein